MKILVTGGSGFIGSELVEALLAKGHEVRNFDFAPPLIPAHLPLWFKGDILDPPALTRAFAGFAPAAVLHLAARADSLGPHIDDYRMNTIGTDNVLAGVKAQPGIERFLFISSQTVHEDKTPPKSDTDFKPPYAYAESKIYGELALRAGGLESSWSIARPTNIWGPRHPRYPKEFWKVVKQGRYLHPGRQPVTRSYGYVGNIVSQMLAWLALPADAIDGRVFYLGDPPLDLYDWTNGFSIELTGRPVRVAPRLAVRGIALVGDVVSGMGLRFPLTSKRFRSMTEDNLAPTAWAQENLGGSPISLESGIRRTVEWLRSVDAEAWT